MALNSYSLIKTAVANWLNESDLTSVIPDFIALAENEFYRRLRIRAMETSFSSTISSGTIAVPSGYVELKHVYVDGTPVQPLKRTSVANIYEFYPTRSADGKPTEIARDGEFFIFAPYPDSTYTIKGTYYKKLDPLSDSNTTNWFTSNASDLLLFGALLEAEPYLKNDQRIPLWTAKYEKILQEIMNEDKVEQLSGSNLMPRVSKY